ncbi:MAG: glycosyltransferase [Gemmatimonadaceae bacterium]
MSRPGALVSVIVPVYQGAGVLGRCVAGLLASDLPRDRWELIVVDDGSTDDAARIAADADRIVRVPDGPRGPAHARNVGAETAAAPLLCFIDADVVVAPHTLRGLVALMDADPTRVAAFGAYDDRPAASGTVSQYRNLLHHYTHTSHAGEAETFWAGCGIVRREAFRAAGGFDAVRYPRPQIEDIDLGYRLRDAGGRILLDPSLTGTHLKRWTFAGMLRTDLKDRAVPWARLLLERGSGIRHAPLNLSLRQKVLTATAASVWVALLVALLLRSPAIAALGCAGIVAITLGNADLFGFFARRRGWWFAARAVPLQLLFHTVGALGAAWALASRPEDALPARRWGVAALSAAVLLLALHAWLAWTMRIPSLTTGGDDASFLALARALREGSYRELWTAGAPIHAMYPPGYPAVLALFGVTEASALPVAHVINLVASITALAFTAVIAGRVTPWLGVAALAILAPNPALVDAAGRGMSEPLFMALLMGTLVALPTGAGAPRRLAIVGACAIAAALTRSIGVVVVAAVVLSLALDGRRRDAGVLVVASALTIGAWFAWTARAPGLAAGTSYIADATYAPTVAPPDDSTGRPRDPAPTDPSFASLLMHRVVVNVPVYLTQAVPIALAQPSLPGTPIDNVVGLACLLVLGAAGTAWIARRHRTVVLLFLGYAGVLAAWPYTSPRFLVPILPVTALILLLGAWRLGGAQAAGSRAALSSLVVTLGLMFATVQPTLARAAEVRQCDRGAATTVSLGCVSPRQRDFFAAVHALDSLADESPVLTAKPSTVFALSGRTTIRQSLAVQRRDPDSLLAWLRDQKVSLVLLSHVHIEQWGLSPMLQSRCGQFEVVRQYPTEVTLLRLRPAPGPAPPAAAENAACSAIERWAGVDWQREVEDVRLGIW